VNLQLDHFPMIKKNKKQKPFLGEKRDSNPLSLSWETKNPKTILPLEEAPPRGRPLFGARLSQRVAMDDLASYFVEERSKVR
jgi:hypothetical protein